MSPPWIFPIDNGEELIAHSWHLATSLPCLWCSLVSVSELTFPGGLSAPRRQAWVSRASHTEPCPVRGWQHTGLLGCVPVALWQHPGSSPQQGQGCWTLFPERHPGSTPWHHGYPGPACTATLCPGLRLPLSCLHPPSGGGRDQPQLAARHACLSLGRRTVISNLQILHWFLFILEKPLDLGKKCQMAYD